jgi:hypothetical protein
VAKKGVLVRSLTDDKNSNSRPSLDMAYKIRGIGNKHPKRLKFVQVSLFFDYRQTMSVYAIKLHYLRGEKSKHCADGNDVFDNWHSQVVVYDRQRCIRVLKNLTSI